VILFASKFAAGRTQYFVMLYLMLHQLEIYGTYSNRLVCIYSIGSLHGILDSFNLEPEARKRRRDQAQQKCRSVCQPLSQLPKICKADFITF
jgi:hypothetical protein